MTISLGVCDFKSILIWLLPETAENGTFLPNSSTMVTSDCTRQHDAEHGCGRVVDPGGYEPVGAMVVLKGVSEGVPGDGLEVTDSVVFDGGTVTGDEDGVLGVDGFEGVEVSCEGPAVTDSVVFAVGAVTGDEGLEVGGVGFSVLCFEDVEAVGGLEVEPTSGVEGTLVSEDVDAGTVVPDGVVVDPVDFCVDERKVSVV